jgi:hypothetical protein
VIGVHRPQTLQKNGQKQPCETKNIIKSVTPINQQNYTLHRVAYTHFHRLN